MSFEFLKYEPASNPEDKHLGIATIRAWGKIILKYKVSPKKDGGFYIKTGSYKQGYDHIKQQDKYYEYFLIDSAYDKETIEELVCAKVYDAIMANQKSADDFRASLVAPQAPTSPSQGQVYRAPQQNAPAESKWAPTQPVSDDVPF